MIRNISDIMGKSAEIPLEKRAEINVLMSEGMSQKQIAAKLGISQSAVSKILKRIVNDGMFTPRPRCGRPKKDDRILRRPRSVANALTKKDPLQQFFKSNGEEPETTLTPVEVEVALIEKAKRIRLEMGKMSDEENKNIRFLVEHSELQDPLMSEESNNKENERLQECSTPQNYLEPMTAQPEFLTNNFLIKLEKEDGFDSFNTRVEETPFQYVNGDGLNCLIKDEPFSFDEEGMEIKVENVRSNIMLMDDESEVKEEIITSVSDIDFCSRNITPENEAMDEDPEYVPTNEVEFLHSFQREPMDEAPAKTKFRKKKKTQDEIPDNLTVQVLEEVLQMSKALSQKIYKIDPVFERSVRFKRALENAMGPYKEFYKRLRSVDNST